MSSDRETRRREKAARKAQAEQARSVSSATERPARRTNSIARSISWSYWWRRLLGFVLLDVVVVVGLLYAFMVQCNLSLPRSVVGNPLFPERSFSVGGDSTPEEWSYIIHLTPTQLEGLLDDELPKDSNSEGPATVHQLERSSYTITWSEDKSYAYVEFPMRNYVISLLPLLCVVAAGELLSLLGILGQTRRVRRKLQPLNDLAIAAEAIGAAAASDPARDAYADDQGKIRSLEQAISAASVDSPTVITGDSDLRGIEVALNGLLRQMQEAKLQQMRFVSDASHELRTPIAVIQGYVGMLARWGKTDEAVLDESIEALQQETDHMQELVEQLLFLARGDSGRNTLSREPLNLADVVLEVWEESAMIDSEHIYDLGISETAATDERFGMVGDLAMVKQSMRIIVQNAAAYSPAGSRVRLAATATDDEVAYVVQDEGMGMTEQEASHIFERFWRSDGARGERKGGSGLGLSIAKWIVDAHDGKIEVLSREGVGTRFTVRFPKGAKTQINVE